MKNKIIVEVWAHDRWSGPEWLDMKKFKTREKAEKFCEKINSKYSGAPDYYETYLYAPDYYEVARIIN